MARHRPPVSGEPTAADVAGAADFEELVGFAAAADQSGRPWPRGVFGRLGELVAEDPGLLGTLQGLLDEPCWPQGSPEHRAARLLALRACRSAMVLLETGPVRRGPFAALRSHRLGTGGGRG